MFSGGLKNIIPNFKNLPSIKRISKLSLGSENVGFGQYHHSCYSSPFKPSCNFAVMCHGRDSKWYRKMPLNVFKGTRNISYVERMKQLDHWKQNPLSASTMDAFQQGKYLLFKNKDVLIDKNCLELLKGNVVVTDKTYQSFETVWLSFQDIKKMKLDKKVSNDAGLGDSCVLLNIDENGTPLFALQLNELDKTIEEYMAAEFNGAFFPILYATFLGTTKKSASLGQAQSLLKWHRQFKFCCFCGGKLQPNTTGLKKVCSSCEKVHYPKPDPAILTVITDETNSKCLLVRQKNFPPGLYSGIAGFLEMGENVEDTVRREVAEEVGLHVEKVDYVTSQHWPLEGTTLMLGCLAIIKPGDEVQLGDNEIEDAKWFSIEELEHAMAFSANNLSLNLKIKRGGTKGDKLLWLPPKPTMANSLFTVWLAKYKS